jgi:acetyl esterase/lipase
MIDWTEAFDNSGHVSGSDRLAGQWAAEAMAFRAAAQAHDRMRADLAYGPGDRNRFDLFAPAGDPAGLVVFVHGGYWQMFDKSFWSHMATGALSAGWAVAMPSYTLAPQARISAITAQIGAAVTAASAQVAGPIRLIGHSAGGHLVMRMVCDDSPLGDAVADRLARVVSVSGVHDLRPLREAAMNDTLHLDAAEAETESPALHTRAGTCPVTLWVGAGERPEFLRQTRLMAEAWPGAEDVYEAGRNHFTVVEGLTRSKSPLVRALLG